jgi:hypothetical protein
VELEVMAPPTKDVDKIRTENGIKIGAGGSGTSVNFTSPIRTRRGEPLKSKAARAEEPILKQTIIRFKRRIEDSPSKILVVSYKRSKLDGSEGGAQGGGGEVGGDGATGPSKEDGDGDDASNGMPSQVLSLRLVGTVPGQEADNNNIAATVRNVLATSSPSIASSLRRNIKARSRKGAEKVREQCKQKAEANRFKIVSSKRGVEDIGSSDITDSSGDKENGTNELLKLLDLVPEASLEKRQDRAPPPNFKPGSVTCNGVPMVKELSSGIQDDHDEVGYVYDLYLTNDPCIEEYMNGQFVSVEEGDEELDFGEYRDGAESDHENYVDDDEDSNAEDNWRNDYPDDMEEAFRFDEDYGYAGIEKIHDLDIHGDSSDDDNPIYGIDDDGGNHAITFDQKYQKFKLRFNNDYADEVVSSASESEIDYGD